ncbi:hypothetical protein ACFLZV_04140 [Candidatus Margulisiibacteriota bacterium]
MSFFQKLFGQKNNIEPFPESQNDSEKMEWFKSTQPWDKVDKKTINAIINKYNDDPMLIVFVSVSMRCNLIPMYCKFNNSESLDSPDLICSFIAQILYNTGSNSLKQMISLMENISINQKKFKLHYSTVMDSLESCIILDEYQISAYSGLAMAKAILNKPEETLKYASQGLNVIEKIRERNVPFHLSDNENIKTATQTFDEIENHLNQLIEKIKTE